MRRKGSERQETLLIVTTLSIMLPITLNAAFMEDCKDRLMDVYTKVCGNDRLKRGIEKFDLKKIDRKKFELAECIDFSLEREKKSTSFDKHEKRDISEKITNPEGEDIVYVNSGSIRENFDNQQRYYRPKSLPSASVRSQDIATENDDVVFEMTVEELYELYNDFNDRSPRRSFTRAERKKILRDFAKTCCYEDNICDNKNVDVLCF